MTVLPYDPGQLPTRPAPAAGEVLEIAVEGYPPYKDIRQSIRNRRTFGPVGLDLTIYAPQLAPGYTLVDYLGGVMDTLDGSSGYTFTFLPIVYEDDCQVVISNMRFVHSESVRYTLRVTFLVEELTI
ncbi:MAG TPA: hypothetical protein VF006_26455 [Longimicrobium sp.]